MALGATIAKLRQDRGLTQADLAELLYVTRQAVSRWETGETMPGIDMCKLIASTLEVPISCLLEMPEWPVCQSCGMPMVSEADHGTEADGTASADYCRHCYEGGTYSYDIDMDGCIEACAPYLAQHTGMKLDEAVSLMGAMLPSLKRWQAVNENERRYGAEARQRYGDEVVDAANAKLMAMDEQEWSDMNTLELAIKEQLRLAMATGDAHSEEAAQLARMHASWIRKRWPEGAYNAQAHLGLAQGYLADERFIKYYDEACGEGATQFLVDALQAHIGQ